MRSLPIARLALGAAGGLAVYAGLWQVIPERVAFAQGRKTSASGGLPLSDKYFKNVKVLTGIPVDEFLGAMGLYSADLSLCCADCHVGAGTEHPDWAADTPRKIVARRMAAMVKKINAQNFSPQANAVTCWTCHRGLSNPAKTPSIDLIYGEPLSFPQDILKPATYGVPTIDQIFDRYLSALGGAGRLVELTSYKATGTSTSYGEDAKEPMDLYAKAPRQMATVVHEHEGDMVRNTDGDQAWIMLPLTAIGAYPLTGTGLEGAKLDAQIAFPAGIRSFFSRWTVAGPTTINGRDAWTVQGSTSGGLVATFYFEKQTGLLSRMIRYANTVNGRVPTQIDFADYHPVAGVMLPFRWDFGWLGGREVYEVSEYQPNVQIDPHVFVKPMPAMASH
jgi:hypothetical protein